MSKEVSEPSRHLTDEITDVAGKKNRLSHPHEDLVMLIVLNFLLWIFMFEQMI